MNPVCLPSCSEGVAEVVKSLLGVAASCQLSVGEAQVIVLGLVSWYVALVAWDVEVLLCHRSALKRKVNDFSKKIYVALYSRDLVLTLLLMSL